MSKSLLVKNWDKMKKQDDNLMPQPYLLIFDLKSESLEAGYESQCDQWNLEKLDLTQEELTK